jgi:ABC-type multidrug transport system fused ATPase/permease subunit
LRLKRGTVTFDHVGFEYSAGQNSHRHRALKDVNFRVEGGTCVALVGRSGAGKTTLASLIPRFYEATAGRVLIDGRDVRHLSLKSLRDAVGFVPQENLVFSSTIRDNLLYGKRGATDAELWEALEQTNLRGFVESLPRGLDTLIGAGGIKLSGGQRQRIALARVFLKDPAILVMDEATSALDSESETQVYDSMWRLMRGRTSFLIAHRLSAAVGADLILVLDDGKLVESGSHEELLARNGLYAQLYNEQIGSLSGGRLRAVGAPR